MQNNRVPAVFLDRDGTLMRERGYCSNPDRVHIYSSVYPALIKLQQAGFLLIVVTNQSGLARGFFSLRTLNAVHQRLRECLKSHQIELSKIYFCPHLPRAGCLCRKPRIGLIKRAVREFKIDMSRSYVIGDQDKDLLLARNAGLPGILVLTGFGKRTQKQKAISGVIVKKNLKLAAEWILAQE